MVEFTKEKDNVIKLTTTEEENKKWHDEYHAKQEKKRRDFIAISKPEVFKMLKSVNIDEVHCYYSGSGDDGSIEDIEYKKGSSAVNLDEQITVDRGERTEWDYDKHVYVTTTKPQKIQDYIEEVVYDLLEAFHGGWEINEGQCGNVLIDVSKGKIFHDYNEIIETERKEEL